nr:unnamed protein product [Callosobruchus chinensis]
MEEATNSHSSVINSTVNYYLNTSFVGGVSHLFEFRLVTNEEILNIISNIKSTATGCDGLNIDMICLCLPAYIKSYHTYNKYMPGKM